jgi:hypothetical protein
VPDLACQVCHRLRVCRRSVGAASPCQAGIQALSTSRALAGGSGEQALSASRALAREPLPGRNSSGGAGDARRDGGAPSRAPRRALTGCASTSREPRRTHSGQGLYIRDAAQLVVRRHVLRRRQVLEARPTTLEWSSVAIVYLRSARAPGATPRYSGDGKHTETGVGHGRVSVEGRAKSRRS